MNGRRSARTSGSGDSSPSSSRRPFRPWVFACNVVLALIVAGLALQVLRAAVRPHCLVWLTEREIKRIGVLQQDADQEHQDVRWEYDHTSTAEGKKSQMRYYGFVKKGEVPFIVPKDCAPAEPPAAASRIVAPTLWERVMLLACRLCGVDPNTVG